MENPNKVQWNKIILIFGLAFAILICPIMWLLGSGWWSEFKIERSLRIYPGAQFVTYAHGYYGADTALRVLYYWTPDTIEDVQRHYEQFTFPFVQDKYNRFTITVFSPDGSALVYRDGISDTEQELDPTQGERCYYTQRYSCVNIWLVSISGGDLADVPTIVGQPWASSAANATPYLSAPLRSGTLIIYGYYVDDF